MRKPLQVFTVRQFVSRPRGALIVLDDEVLANECATLSAWRQQREFPLVDRAKEWNQLMEKMDRSA